jgi:hypothetical protein
MPTHNLRMEEFSMKKLLFISAILAAVTVGAFAADPIGIDVGSDINFDGVNTDLVADMNPFIAYKHNVAGISAKATLSYDFPIYQDFLIDEGTFQAKVYGSKTFSLSDTLSLTPGLTVRYYYNTALDEDQSKFRLDPEATLGYGKFYTLLVGKTTLVPDSAFTLYVEEGTSIGAFSPYVYFDYNISPDAELGDIGLGVAYGWKAWTFVADGSFYGFKDDEDLTYYQSFQVKYSF